MEAREALAMVEAQAHAAGVAATATAAKATAAVFDPVDSALLKVACVSIAQAIASVRTQEAAATQTQFLTKLAAVPAKLFKEISTDPLPQAPTRVAAPETALPLLEELDLTCCNSSRRSIPPSYSCTVDIKRS